MCITRARTFSLHNTEGTEECKTAKKTVINKAPNSLNQKGFKIY